MTINKRFLSAFFLSAVLIVFIFDMNGLKVNLLRSASVFPVLLFGVFVFFLLFRFLYRFREFKRRDLIIAFISSLFFSVFYVIGYQLDNTDNVIINLATVISIINIFIMYSAAITNLLDRSEKISNFDFRYDTKFFNRIFSKYIFIWAFIFICTVPYIIALNPGAVTPDSYNILMQASGSTNLNAGHPVFYTLIIRCIYKLSSSLGLSMYYTVLFYSIFQALIMSAIFAYSIFTLHKMNCKLYYLILLLLFYSFFPLFPIYSITLWKDVFFGGMILLFTIYLYKAKTDESFFSNFKKIFILALITMGVLLFRTNGILVVLMSLPFVLIILKKYFLKALAALAIPVICYILFITIGFNVLGVDSFRSNEAFTIPYQHLARIYTEEAHLDKEDEEFMQKVFTKKEGVYNPKVSDIARCYFADLDYFENNKAEFFNNWFRLVKKYPVTLIKSFINNNFGFWYPNENSRLPAYSVIYDCSPFLSVNPSLGDIQRRFHGTIGNTVASFLLHNSIVNRFTSVGLAYTVFAILFLITLSRKNKKFAILFVPAFALWLGVILGSPLYAELRYVYGLFTSLPFIIAIILFGPEASSKSFTEETTVKTD